MITDNKIGEISEDLNKIIEYKIYVYISIFFT
jgi:hypothetical protein